MPENKHLVLSSFFLKIIAMVAVLSDHIAFVFVSPALFTYDLMRIIGRLAFILFAFFVSEGIVKTRNYDRYLLRLFIMYLVMQALSIVAFSYDSSFAYPNVFATLLAGASFLTYFETKRWKRVYYLVPFIAVMIINYLFYYQRMSYLKVYTGDYAFYGLALIIAFYIGRKIALYLYAHYIPAPNEDSENKSNEQNLQKQFVLNVASSVSLLFITFIWYILSVFSKSSTNMALQSYGLITIFLLLLYNGKLGYNQKPFRIIYYLFFPVHLIIIALISILI